MVLLVERQVYARVTAEEYAELERRAAEGERTLAAEVRLAIRAWLTKKPAKAAA